LSRFFIIEIPEYTFEEFKDIAVARLTKEKVDKQVASVITEKVWNELGSTDIRDVIKIGRLASSSEDVSFIIKMLNRRESKLQFA
jgi:hypothetical protein